MGILGKLLDYEWKTMVYILFFIIGLIDNIGYQWVYPPGASNVASCEFMYKALYINVYYKL